MTALVTTAGFRDVLELRRLRIPHMYDPFWRKPDPLVPRRLRLELAERMTRRRRGARAARRGRGARARGAAARRGVESVAVCLLHSLPLPRARGAASARSCARSSRASTVSLSSEILREQREYERSATTVVNAYVRPLMGRYVGDIRRGLDGAGVDAPLTIMQSSGGVMTVRRRDAAARARARVGPGRRRRRGARARAAARLRERDRVRHGRHDREGVADRGRRRLAGREYEAGGSLSAGSRLMRGAGELLRIPTIDIAEVGAGGGSIAWLDPAGGLQVGPAERRRRAGARLLRARRRRADRHRRERLPRLHPGRAARRPAISGLAASSPRRRSSGVAEPLGSRRSRRRAGIHALANARMTRALRSVSSEKGRDPRDFALIAYGGSGPVHAAASPRSSACTTVLVPALAGLFSSLGLLFARPEFHDVHSVPPRRAGRSTPPSSPPILDELRARIAPSLDGDVEWVPTAELRYGGQSWEVEVELRPPAVDEERSRR